MAALRVVCLNCERPVHPHPRLVDIGTGSALGHVHDGGRLVRPESTERRPGTPAGHRQRDGLRGPYGPRCYEPTARTGVPCGRVLGHAGYCRPVREPIHDERLRAVWAAASRRYRERRRVTA